MIKVILSLTLGVLICSSFAIAENQEAFSEVPNDKVCMVNDKFMGEEQIKIPIEGKTYYGCCKMCITKLKTDLKARKAIDPLSGEAVDKSSAYIVAKPDKRVLYFASKENYEVYKKR